MRALLLAVGRMKKGPERELAQRYGERLATAGRSVGLTGLDMVELPESRATQPAQRQGEEAQSLLAKVPDEAALIVFDERGRTLDSPAFAKLIGDTIDVARQPVVVIGGADGLDGSVRDRAQTVVSFGRLTMPHQIVRILVLEQLYRAVTILSGHPYHKP